MHTGTLRKMALALTFWLALHMSALRAQIFTAPLQASTTGTDPVDFEFRADGTLISKGNFGVGSLLSGDEGAGTRMFWFPSVGAFRAGGTDSAYGTTSANAWDPGQLGSYSVAFGLDSWASGDYSAAFGYWTRAWGYDSFGTGGGAAYGGYSFAGGCGNSATGAGGISLGTYNAASGTGAVALGGYNTSSGYFSMVMGALNSSSGSYTTASGLYTTATAFASFTIGTFNVGGGNPTSWVGTDPVFEIGNGTSSAPSDALVVYKNGNAALQGTLEVAPGGDIPMYTGE
jgi:hypothetical protein